MRLNKILPVALVLLVGTVLVLFALNRPATAQESNLLANPSFEGQFSSYVPELPQEVADCSLGVCTTAQVPAGWKPWWVKERPTDVNPEFKPATRDIGGNRVRSGDRAAQYFSFWSTHKAGLRQTVTVPTNSVVLFTVWGHSWLQEIDGVLTSDYAGTSNMRIGIDPTGGIDAYSPSIVWSGFQQAFDSYTLFSVQTQAVGDKVTVFTFSAPDVNPNSPTAGFKHTDIYWDDASLTVVGAGSAPSAPPPSSGNDDGGAAVVAAPPIVIGPTATPDAEGIIYTEVQPGDSLWALAARAGMDLSEFLEINEITRDTVIRAGEMYITGFGDPPEVTTETVEEEVTEVPVEAAEAAGGTGEAKEPEPTPVPEVTPEVVAVTEVESNSASICLTAFDDSNENGIMEGAEMLRPAVAFTITNNESVVSNYVTDGSSEPFCITGLDAGNYNVTRSGLSNESLTTPGNQAISLEEGNSIDLRFGSIIQENEETQTLAVESAAPEQDGGVPDILVIAAIVVGVLLLIAVVILLITRRRNSTA